MGIGQDSFSSEIHKNADLDVIVTEQSEGIVKDWTDAEERRVVRKLDFTLLPIMAFAFFALQMDRGNISTALTSSITTDLGVSTNEINTGSQLLSAGIVLLEIPSNILLQKVGPHYWLSGQVILWSVVATFQSFMQTYPQYLTTRLLLGLLESGFIPGGLYYLSTWYKARECSTRTTVFFFGNLFAAATSSLIGAGLLTLDGVAGRAGWRWVFLVEGAIGLGIGFIFFLILPPKTGDGRPFISFGKWSYYNERETYIIRQRILYDDPLKEQHKLNITARDVWDTVKQKRIWTHFFITLSAQTGFQGVSTYSPSIIKKLGYSAPKANELASVSTFLGIVWVFLLARLSDWTGLRGWVVLGTTTYSLITFTVFTTVGDYADKHAKYASLVFAGLSVGALHVLNVGWLTVNCRTPKERCIALAMIIMAANCGGISGGQVFRADDAPLYHRGFIIACSMLALTFVLVLGQNIQYYVNRAKFPHNAPVKRGEKAESEISA